MTKKTTEQIAKEKEKEKRLEEIRIESLHLALRNKPAEYHPAVVGTVKKVSHIRYDLVKEAKIIEKYIKTGV